ncbi:MAG TPA: 50S ribosomal protein L17 [Candidatus Megaira endosymbiont of Hartmannula sinica]|nr:50S ribosomal protein L17 [Candidatus Megaera endosymbiont of Hartmannula sinica]
MYHRLKLKKLNRSTSHRKSMLANMSCSLITHEQIKTTLPKAKALRPYLEKLVTKARKGDFNAFRYINSEIKDKSSTKKLIDNISKRYQNRNGGYLRIVKTGFRYGDDAPMAVIEFVDRDLKVKGVSVEKQLAEAK